MTEKSYYWTTGGGGDAGATVTRADLAQATMIVAACAGANGIAPVSSTYDFGGTAPAANTARIANGYACIDGHPYYSNANVDVTIPSAVGAGNTRIDRIVLRADWSAQTVRITLVSGTDANPPSVPAITQTPGTTYDVQMWQALVDTSGNVTLTDERYYAVPGAGMIPGTCIEDATITTTQISASAGITGSQLAAGAGITGAQLAAAAAIGAGQIANLVRKRQGGSATDWDAAGASDYTPTAGIAQAGVATTDGTASVTVTFGTAFAYKPLVLLTVHNSGGIFVKGPCAFVDSVSTTQAVIKCIAGDGTGVTGIPIGWLAIGPV